MSEFEIEYRALCQRMIKGIQEARQILEEAEKDCQKMFEAAVYSQIGRECEQIGDKRHALLQKAAEEERKLFE